MAAVRSRARLPRMPIAASVGCMPRPCLTALAAQVVSSNSARTRFNMRYGLLAAVLLVAATLGGCNEGVLDPKGPIALAERQILFNATGIMLAIVIPVVIATLGVAFWFRASNERARYQPDFTYSGRIELLVWSIPLMTVLLTGMVAWIGAYDLDPPKALASST